MNCGICGKEVKMMTHTHLRLHNMGVQDYLARFPNSKMSWNKGETKETDPRIKAWTPKGHCLGHKPTFSREALGDRYDEINRLRSEKISKNANIEGCKRGALRSSEIRKANGTYRWCEDAVGRKSPKYKGRIPWNKGKTKHSDDRIGKIWAGRRKYPEGIDFALYGWTLAKRQEVRNRDGWKCKMCGVSQKELKKVLVVHHRDANKLHNDLDNLVVLCRNCHQKVHLEQDLKTGQFRVRKECLSV